MRKILAGAICTAILNIGNAYAIRIVSEDITSIWGGDNDATESAGDFIIGGCTGKSCDHGTYTDEWGIIGIIANTITEHGGYFCPYQLQCANKRKQTRSWTTYYHPNGFDTNKCSWLCETDYSGMNCASPADAVPYCDKQSYNLTIKHSLFGATIISSADNSIYSGISLKTSGGGDNEVEEEIIGFKSTGKDPECDWILGVIQFLEHGVIAAPIKVCCDMDNWKDVDSFVDSVYKVNGSQKILCATGYTANANKTDCVPINSDICTLQDMKMCDNFDKSEYNSSIHYLEQNNDCAKFFCSEPGKAFPAVGNYSCEDCASGPKGGANTTNGVCVKCQTGQYFDKASNSCKPAKAYSKTDLMYGSGKSKNTTKIGEQCWTKVTPAEYKECVQGQSTSN